MSRNLTVVSVEMTERAVSVYFFTTQLGNRIAVLNHLTNAAFVPAIGLNTLNAAVSDR